MTTAGLLKENGECEQVTLFMLLCTDHSVESPASCDSYGYLLRMDFYIFLFLTGDPDVRNGMRH